MKKLVTFLGVVFSLFLSAQTVQLDKTFGNSNGFEILDGETIGDVCSFILPDGKILVSGNRINGANLYENFIARFKSDGQIDTSFGTNGFSIIDNFNIYGCRLLLADNHIFALFSNPDRSNPDISENSIMKFDLDGNLDTSFGNMGKIEFSQELLSDRKDNIFQDGNYLYVEVYYPVAKIKRFDIKTGGLDPTFGTNGEVVLPISKSEDDYMIHTSDNKILIGSVDWWNPTFNLYKFNMDGSLDTSFGNNGTTIVNRDEDYSTYGVSESGGSIIVTLGNYDYDDEGISLYKFYTSNGQPVTSFGDNGILSMENTIYVSGIKFFSDKIYLTGENKNEDLGLWRLNADGSYDTAFNKTGEYIETSHADMWTESFNINSDGSIILSGEFSSGSSVTNQWGNTETYKIFLAKYLVDESLATEDLSPKAKVALYPNPVKDMLYFSAKGKVAKADIYDLNGRLVKTAAVSNNSVNVSSLSKGMYFIILHTDKGVVKEKFIKN